MTVLVNKKDLKVKHASNEYSKLPSAPEPDDIVYFMVQKKKKTTTVDELAEFFGEDKLPKIYESIEWLTYHGNLKEMTTDKIEFELIKNGTVS